MSYVITCFWVQDPDKISDKYDYEEIRSISSFEFWEDAAEKADYLLGITQVGTDRAYFAKSKENFDKLFTVGTNKNTGRPNCFYIGNSDYSKKRLRMIIEID